MDEGGDAKHSPDLATRQLGRRVKRVAWEANLDGWLVTLVA